MPLDHSTDIQSPFIKKYWPSCYLFKVNKTKN